MGHIKVKSKLQTLMEREFELESSVGNVSNTDDEERFDAERLQKVLEHPNLRRGEDDVEGALLKRKLTKQRPVIDPSSESLLKQVPSNEKYLDSAANFHYTSSFQARPYSDYFEFDTERKKDIVRGNRSSTGVIDGYAPGHKHDVEDTLDSDDEDECSSSLLDSVDSSDNSIQKVIDQIVLFKSEFKDLIAKIDEAAMQSCRSRSVHGDEKLLNHSEVARYQDDRIMTTVIDSVIHLLHNLLPSYIESKREIEYDGDGVGPPTKKLKLEDLRTSVSAEEVNSTVEKAPAANATPLEFVDDDPCCKLPNFGVILIKSPSMISQLWDEYTKLPSEWAIKDLFAFRLQQKDSDNVDIRLISNRRTSIRELERKYGSSWRNTDKNFSRQINRRKKIWCAIEEGLNDGLELKECFDILESYVKNRGKGLSWYYNGVPFKLKDMRYMVNLPAKKKVLKDVDT